MNSPSFFHRDVDQRAMMSARAMEHTAKKGARAFNDAVRPLSMQTVKGTRFRRDQRVSPLAGRVKGVGERAAFSRANRNQRGVRKTERPPFHLASD